MFHLLLLYLTYVIFVLFFASESMQVQDRTHGDSEGNWKEHLIVVTITIYYDSYTYF